jgi:hypothetical protein
MFVNKKNTVKGDMNMKKWNAPEVSELNINETASGSMYDITEDQFINDGGNDINLWMFVKTS